MNDCHHQIGNDSLKNKTINKHLEKLSCKFPMKAQVLICIVKAFIPTMNWQPVQGYSPLSPKSPEIGSSNPAILGRISISGR